MKRAILLTAVAVGLLGAPQSVTAQEKKPGKTKLQECYCTDRYGKRHEMGDIICLTVDNRSYEAKCVMVLNNPFWRDQNRGCLSSSLPPNMSLRSNELATLYR